MKIYSPYIQSIINFRPTPIKKIITFFIFSICLFFPPVYSQSCIFPSLDVVYLNPTSSINWSNQTFISRVSKVDSNIWMKSTWVGRSNVNVSIGNFDLTTTYGYAWQPTINFPSSTSSTDTSWAEFLIEFFLDSLLSTPKVLPCLSMTVVDCDGSGNSTGSNSYREMIQVTRPVVSRYILGSQITRGNVGNWETLVSGFSVFNNIDTANKSAMIQLEFDSVSSFNARLGVIGQRISNPTNRQFSLHFKAFDFPTLLPINLSFFDVKEINGHIQLNWTVLSEKNNKLFEIERRLNLGGWINLGQVYETENGNYSFIDHYPVNGELEYRIKQIDYSGNYIYSNLISISFGISFDSEVDAVPNPFGNYIEIKGLLSPRVIVTNQLGLILIDSKNKTLIDSSFLNSGVYYIKIISSRGNLKIFKMVKY